MTDPNSSDPRHECSVKLTDRSAFVHAGVRRGIHLLPGRSTINTPLLGLTHRRATQIFITNAGSFRFTASKAPLKVVKQIRHLSKFLRSLPKVDLHHRSDLRELPSCPSTTDTNDKFGDSAGLYS